MQGYFFEDFGRQSSEGREERRLVIPNCLKVGFKSLQGLDLIGKRCYSEVGISDYGTAFRNLLRRRQVHWMRLYPGHLGLDINAIRRV